MWNGLGRKKFPQNCRRFVVFLQNAKVLGAARAPRTPEAPFSNFGPDPIGFGIPRAGFHQKIANIEFFSKIV